MLASGKTHFVISKKSGTALNLSGDDQRSIGGFDRHGGDNQKWHIIQHPEHRNGWTIQNVHNKKYFDVESNPGDGVKIIAVDTRNPKKWDICCDGDGWRISIQGSNQTVDLSDHGNPASGTSVTLWGKWIGKNQVWMFEQA